jgi:hypothetical protein
MTGSAVPPAEAGKRRCGICSKPLSQYNKDDICMSHKAEDVLKYRANSEKKSKESRALHAFIREFHHAGAVEDMLTEAKKGESARNKRRPVIELEHYVEALGLLKIASLIFRLSMPAILRKTSTSSKPKTARDVLTYIMRKDLEMSSEDIATFFGYAYLPRVAEAVERISKAMLAEFDEDIVCAVDLVRQERDVRSEADAA